ncbi:MAG: triose-phosphate isomerase [Candidatus Moranbacteria bacterium]|nr:triose-phosphate isomerase [Candidatus Moranbacteria bacterium]
MLFIANWKMNPTSLKQAQKLNKNIKDKLKKINKEKKAKVIICPPTIFLSKLFQKNKLIQYGVQNICFEERGAYTGEISVLMAKDQGANYSIIGHSERKQIAGEDNYTISQKVNLCLANNIKPILCVGENLQEKNHAKTGLVIREQLQIALKNVKINDIEKIIIAYEPVWAISSQDNARPGTPDSILGASIIIRKELLNLYNHDVATNIPVIYGGSVSKDNVLDYSGNSNLNGFLIGSASLNAFDFSQIIEKYIQSAQKQT